MWLIDQDVMAAMQAAVKAGFDPTSDQITSYESRMSDSARGGSRILSKAGNSAEIQIVGVLTNRSSFMAMIFGGGNTTYSEIISAIAEAEADADVEKITFAIDSPGGQVDGLFDTIAAIQDAKKPSVAVVSNRAASAAYALASVADSITAGNKATSFGSIGIVADFSIWGDEVTITSDKAPKKRPDVKTPEGVKIIKEELNTLHDLFVEAIATGRGVTDKKVNADFGEGAMLFAEDALKAGMIDDITGTKLATVPAIDNQTTASGGGKPKGAFMDLAKFKAEYPDVFVQAVGIGTEQERDRVGAFVIAGEQSGDMKTALQAIKDGTEMTTTLSTTFMMAAANRGDIQARDKDADDADPGNVAAAAAAADDHGAAVVALVKDLTGYEGVDNG